MTIRLRSGVHVDRRRVERRAGGPTSRVEAGAQVGAAVERRPPAVRRTRMFSGATCFSSPRTRSTSGKKRSSTTRRRARDWLSTPGEHLAAQPGVDAEQRQPGVGAAAEEREQLEVVLEQHRDVPGTGVVDRAEAPQEEVRHAHRLVAELAIGPRAVALHEQDLVLGHADAARAPRSVAHDERRVEC